MGILPILFFFHGDIVEMAAEKERRAAAEYPAFLRTDEGRLGNSLLSDLFMYMTRAEVESLENDTFLRRTELRRGLHYILRGEGYKNDPTLAMLQREFPAVMRALREWIRNRPPGKAMGGMRGGGFDDVFGTRPGSVPVQTTNDPVQMAKWEAEGNAALAARQAAAQAAIQKKLDDEKREGWKKTFGIMGDVFSSVGGLTKLIPGAGAVLSPVANTIGNLYKLGSGHSGCPCRGGAKEHSAFLRQLRKVGIEPKLYLSKAKSKAKKEGYDPATL